MASPAGDRPIGFLTWSSPAPTGGNAYDDRLTAELLAAGLPLVRHRVRGTWPTEADRHRAEVAETLRTHEVWLVDSIVACAAPEVVAGVADRGGATAVLLHSLLSTEVGLSPAEQERYRKLEGTALRAADRVITTSAWAAAELLRRYDVTRTVVARPGVDPAPLTTTSATGNRLLSLGSLTPTKDQLSLLAALDEVADLQWSARLAGADQVLPDYTAAVRRAVADHRRPDRIMITGPLTGADLAQTWAGTDLLVVTSRSETYGMVVVEALAHGIPAIVPAGTGAVEALGEVDGELPGASFGPGRPDDLAELLRHWLSDPALRQRWRTTARRRRDTLDVWSSCATTVHHTLAALARRDHDR